MLKSMSTIDTIKLLANNIKELIDRVEPRLNDRQYLQANSAKLASSFDDKEPPWPGEWDNRETDG